MREAVIVGVGCTVFKPITPEVSYKELMFEAVTRAYEDAGFDPRQDIDSFICCSEDYWEGFSIFDSLFRTSLARTWMRVNCLTF